MNIALIFIYIYCEPSLSGPLLIKKTTKGGKGFLGLYLAFRKFIVISISSSLLTFFHLLQLFLVFPSSFTAFSHFPLIFYNFFSTFPHLSFIFPSVFPLLLQFSLNFSSSLRLIFSYSFIKVK